MQRDNRFKSLLDDAQNSLDTIDRSSNAVGHLKDALEKVVAYLREAEKSSSSK